MIVLAFLALLQASAPRPVSKNAAASHGNADLLGFNCVELLELMDSTDWIAKFTAAKGRGDATTIRAINAYGKCYDARTDRMAAELGKTGKGPQARARANFHDLEVALKAFAASALMGAQTAHDVKAAYVGLYEKQFRYEFYEAYEPKPASTSSSTDSGDADPVTQAKNHFGALLNDLPPDRMHELHAAFGHILGPNTATWRMQLLVYRYAIFLLEPNGSEPFAPPPF